MGEKDFSYWSTKRPFNLAVKYLHQPWNREGKKALRMLQHVTLATRSFDPDLLNWSSNRMERAREAFEKGDYTLVSSIAQEILTLASVIKNPLNITIDGEGSEWENLDPVYFNPSQAFPPFSEEEWFRDAANLKSVYAINDAENLYLMLEFYGSRPEWLPSIAIDTSGEWSHEDGKEFHITLYRESADLWKVSYTGLTSGSLVPKRTMMEKVSIMSDNVVELRVPLEILGNPRKINMIVWYPCEKIINQDSILKPIMLWGDFEVEMVKWGGPAEFRVTGLSISPIEAQPGEPIMITTKVTNIREVERTYTLSLKINGTTREAKNVTLKGGESLTVMFIITEDVPGIYIVEVDGMVGTFKVTAPKSAEFALTDLTITPTRVGVKQTVTISVEVTNIGEQAGIHSVDLKLNGVVVDTKTVSLKGGESVVVTFQVIIDKLVHSTLK